MRTLRCPICKKEVPLKSPEMPFCSERCRLIDLGKWADEEYRIPGPSAPDLRETPPGEEDDIHE